MGEQGSVPRGPHRASGQTSRRASRHTAPDDLAVHDLDNGEVRLGLLPSVGGRLISVRCGGVELLWHDPALLDEDLRPVVPRSAWPELDGTMATWANIGGAKTWPAPQGWSGPDEWPGPPDAVLDAGVWSLEQVPGPGEGEVTARMTSPDDERTGLRVVRELTLPRTGTLFRQRTTFTSISSRPVRWAVWEVCQVDTSLFAGAALHDDVVDPGIHVGVAGEAEPVSMVEAVGAITVGAPAHGVRHVPVTPVVAKVGFVDATGDLVLVRPDGAQIRWTFAVETAGAVYPDGGCQVELWMQHPLDAPLPDTGLQPSAHLVELEALSPLTTLSPGQSLVLDLTWQVRGPVAR